MTPLLDRLIVTGAIVLAVGTVAICIVTLYMEPPPLGW